MENDHIAYTLTTQTGMMNVPVTTTDKPVLLLERLTMSRSSKSIAKRCKMIKPTAAPSPVLIRSFVHRLLEHKTRLCSRSLSGSRYMSHSYKKYQVTVTCNGKDLRLTLHAIPLHAIPLHAIPLFGTFREKIYI